MKKTKLKILLLCTAIIMIGSSAFAAKVKDKKKVPFTQTDGIQLVKDMGFGWNLGNTFDANGSKGLQSENSWGQPTTTQEMIKGIAQTGLKTIRIPVSWANHIIDDKFTIDPSWMARVKQVVDWAIQENLYVIINTHHDNFERANGMPHCGGYYPNPVNYNESMLFIKNVWKQITVAFNNGYDEHLIFEVMNEPRLRGHAHEWYYNANCNDCIYGAQTINKLNQIALNTIRESGGNNKKRFVMIPGIAGSFDCVTGKNNPFKLPKDYTDEKITNQRLIMSIHLYKPHTLAMENPGESAFNDRHKKELDFYFETMNKDFIQNGIPVVIGEYGCTNKNNLEDRVNYFNYYTDKAKEVGISCILWDNGDYNTNGTFLEKFGYYNRLEQTWYFPEIIQAILD